MPAVCRWKCQPTAGAEAPAGLGEQQRGPQHRQHAEHALFQQQHGVALGPLWTLVLFSEWGLF